MNSLHGWLLGVVLGLGLASGCIQPRDLEADRRAIAHVREQALTALNAEDTEALLALLDEDIVLIRSGSTTLVGHGPVGAHLREFLAQVDLEVSREETRLNLADEWAFDHSVLTGTWKPKAGGLTRTINVRVSDLFKLQYDDSWKYRRLMGLPTLEEPAGEEPASQAASRE